MVIGPPYAQLRARFAQAAKTHPVALWLLPSLHFIMHQLRFSDLVVHYAKLVVESDDMWASQTEEALESLLRRATPSIMEQLKALWAIMSNKEDPDARYEIERKNCPWELLSKVGGYKLGPFSWPWEVWPFRRIGVLMQNAAATSSKAVVAAKGEDVAFRALRKQVLDALPFGVHVCEKHMMTHKLRTQLCCQGRSPLAVGWCGGDDMSDSNIELYRKLGEPTTTDFKVMMQREMLDLECGYTLDCVGEVMTVYCNKDPSLVPSLVKHIRQMDIRPPSHRALDGTQRLTAHKEDLWPQAS